jgi:hypothetical protein
MELVSALQIPYRESRDGFWGEQTSTLNWCEEVTVFRLLDVPNLCCGQPVVLYCLQPNAVF